MFGWIHDIRLCVHEQLKLLYVPFCVCSSLSLSLSLFFSLPLSLSLGYGYQSTPPTYNPNMGGYQQAPPKYY